MSLFVKDESAICCLKCDLIKPISPLEDEDDYLNEIRAGSINNDLGHLASLKKITFNLDSFNKHNELNDEIDPNLNLCLNRLPDAHYTAPSAILDKFDRFKEMSNIMHINTRSVGSKMIDLQFLLQQVPVS